MRLYPAEAPRAPSSPPGCCHWHKPAERADSTGKALPAFYGACAQVFQMFKAVFVPENASSTKMSRAGS